MEEVYCPLCKEKNSTFVFSSDGYELRACNVCDLKFINPYVQKEKDRNPLSLQKQIVSEDKAVKFYFKYIAEYFKIANSYLDIGCGCGGLLKKVEEFNIPVTNGVEEDKSRAAYAKMYTGCEIFDGGIFGMNGAHRYDLISLINVFSHIPDLDLFFYKLNEMLKDDGRIIIKTGLLKKGFRKYNFFDWQIPEHVHFMGDNTVTYIAKKYNFRCSENIEIPLGDEFITKEYFSSPGRSNLKNILKQVLSNIPGVIVLLRFIFAKYTRNKLYTSLVVLQKR